MKRMFVIGIIALLFTLGVGVMQDDTFETLRKTKISTITFEGVNTCYMDRIDDNRDGLIYNEDGGCRKGVQVAVYSGPGSWNDGVVAFKHFLNWKGITWEEINDWNINHRNLSALYDALYMPGGRPDIYEKYINDSGNQHIRELVGRGGAYIGICAGAYYAASTMHFDEWTFEFYLKLFNGTAYGPLNPIVPWDEYTMTQLNMVADHPINEYEPPVEEMLYYGGPAFYPNQDQNMDIIATWDAYCDDPAIISFQFGEGRVILIGSHPEIEEDSDRDGTDCAQELEDNGSDWNFLWTALDWAMGWNISKPPSLEVDIVKPQSGYLYLMDRQILSLQEGKTVVLGRITVKADVSNAIYGIEKADFFIDNQLKYIDNEEPYEWLWDEFAIGKHEIKVIAYDNKGNNAKDKMDVIISNIGQE